MEGLKAIVDEFKEAQKLLSSYDKWEDLHLAVGKINEAVKKLEAFSQKAE